jgi:hypothetical protein
MQVVLNTAALLRVQIPVSGSNNTVKINNNNNNNRDK